MNQKEKCLEYYLDSRIYDREAVEKTIVQAKQEFPEKEVDISIYLNEWGVYVITLYFRNKNNMLQNINTKIRPKKIFEKRNIISNSYTKELESKKYGQYKQTKTYRPY